MKKGLLRRKIQNSGVCQYAYPRQVVVLGSKP